jgi:perosamine synthetase
MKILFKILNKIQNVVFSSYYGFIYSHSHINYEQIKKLKKLIILNSHSLVQQYELAFAKLIGSGNAVSFASGRMGFFQLMKQLKIRENDEVIILGATCSVMVNAILKTKATPIYSDMDPETFGSCGIKIEEKITSKTKLIIAQHSFGIPCRIDRIVILAKEKNIFLLEDCALTVNSSFKGINVGNFGDAALFSTDHSKPINTILGGLIYSKDDNLINKLRMGIDESAYLPLNKKKSIWKRFLFEKLFFNPSYYGIINILEPLFKLQLKILNYPNPFLNEEFGSKTEKKTYPYPSKLPPFLAALGLLEIERWHYTASRRKNTLEYFLKQFKKEKLFHFLPESYKEGIFNIIPLRIAFVHPNGFKIRKKLNRIIDVSQTWFLKPIVATSEPLENFKYFKGSCPISELKGYNIINIPCNISEMKLKEIIKILVVN